ncbi:hypothetical protein L1887_31969 [Cichorium endivia]|nr:hypothetical protein L1887_31969 [Cichorium endivia]
MANNNNTGQESRRIMKVKRLSENAVMPVKSSIGFILASAARMTVRAGIHIEVPTDLAFNVPPETSFRFAPLPGREIHSVLGRLLLSSKEPQVVSVTIWNRSNTELKIEPGDPIGQLKVLFGYPHPELVEEIVPSKNARSGQDLVNTDPKRPRTKD